MNRKLIGQVTRRIGLLALMAIWICGCQREVNEPEVVSGTNIVTTAGTNGVYP